MDIMSDGPTFVESLPGEFLASGDFENYVRMEVQLWEERKKSCNSLNQWLIASVGYVSPRDKTMALVNNQLNFLKRCIDPSPEERSGIYAECTRLLTNGIF